MVAKSQLKFDVPWTPMKIPPPVSAHYVVAIDPSDPDALSDPSLVKVGVSVDGGAPQEYPCTVMWWNDIWKSWVSENNTRVRPVAFWTQCPFLSAVGYYEITNKSWRAIADAEVRCFSLQGCDTTAKA